MFTKIVFAATAAAFLLSTASAPFAAPKNQQAPEAMYSSESTATPNSKTQKSKRIPEPLYFQHATGEAN
jgi:hypothetical protein